MLAYRVLHGDASRYLGRFTSTADVPGRRALRSAGTKRLVVPPVRLFTVGSRAFPVAAAQIWNYLPEHIVSAPTLQSFGRHLKTFLLQQYFCLWHFNCACSGFGYLGHLKNYWLLELRYSSATYIRCDGVVELNIRRRRHVGGILNVQFKMQKSDNSCVKVYSQTILFNLCISIHSSLQALFTTLHCCLQHGEGDRHPMHYLTALFGLNKWVSELMNK